MVTEGGQCRGVEINIDGRMIGTRYPMEANLVGDSKNTLRELIPLLQRKDDRSWQDKIEKEVKEWWAVLDKRAHDKADPLNPELVVHELSKRLPDNAILTTDAGSVANWWARHLRLRQVWPLRWPETWPPWGRAHRMRSAPNWPIPDVR